MASTQAPDPDLFAIGQEPHFISARPRLHGAIPSTWLRVPQQGRGDTSHRAAPAPCSTSRRQPGGFGFQNRLWGGKPGAGTNRASRAHKGGQSSRYRPGLAPCLSSSHLPISWPTSLPIYSHGRPLHRAPAARGVSEWAGWQMPAFDFPKSFPFCLPRELPWRASHGPAFGTEPWEQLGSVSQSCTHHQSGTEGFIKHPGLGLC